MTFRVATVSFLNALPLVDGLADMPADELQLTWHLPSQLGELLHADEADAALLPVVELFRGHGSGLVPGIGIAARGPVASVKLFTRVAPATLTRVVVDRASRTSVALLRILLAELHGIRPDFHALEPKPEDLFGSAEATLVIGDLCFAAEKKLRDGGQEGIQVLDLAELWVSMTGLPFVFAAWALGERFAARASAAEQACLTQLLTRARDRGLANLDTLAEREAAAGRLGPGGEATPAALRYYFQKSLQYVLGENEMAGLNRFYELCLRHAICPAGCSPRLAAAGTGE